MYVAYIRCSTNIQENSPERQRDEITAWANNQGVSIDEWYVESPISGSASIADRPQLTAALDSLQKNDTLVVADLTRISRSQMHFSMALGILHTKGAHIAFADGHEFIEDDMMSRLMTNILAFCAEWERRSISTRVKQGLKVVAKTKALGRPDRCKFGWRNVEGCKVAHDTEQAIGRYIQAARKSRTKYKVIEKELVKRSWFNRNGNPFSIPAIAHINRTFDSV